MSFSSNSKTSLFDDVDETEDPFAPQKEEEGAGTTLAKSTQSAESSAEGGVVLNGPLSGGGEGVPAEWTAEEEVGEDFVMVSISELSPDEDTDGVGKGGGATSDGSRPSSTSGGSGSDFHKSTSTDDQKTNMTKRADQVRKDIRRTPSPLDIYHPPSASPPPASPTAILTSPTSRERTSSITVKVVKVTSRTPSISSRESSVVSPEPSSDGKSDRRKDGEKDKQLADATAQISDLTSRLKQEQSEVAALRADKARLEQEVADLKTVEEILQEEVQKLKGDNLVLKSDFMDVKTDKELLEEEMASLKARFEIIEVAWKQREEEFENLQKQLAENPPENPPEKLPEKPAEEKTGKPTDAPTEAPAIKVTKTAQESKEKGSPARKPGARKRPNSADTPRTKSRAGVHKENTGSVRDTVKKFSAAGGAGSPEVKRIVRPKNSVRKSSLTESETAKPKTASPKITRGEKTVTPVKQRKPVPSRPPLPPGKGRQPTSTETASHHQKVHKAEATVSEVPPAETLTSEVPPANTSSSELPPAENSTSELPPTGNLELPKDKESGPPQATMEVDSPVHHRILKDTTSTLTAEVKDTAPPAEEDEQKSTAELAFERLMSTHSPEKEAEEGERKEEEPAPSVHPVEEPEESVNGEQGEDVPRALKLISAFEQKKSTAAAETPPWKKNLREELHSNLGEEASKPEEEEKPHRAANLPPKPKPVPVPRAVRAKSPEPSKTSEPPKATPRVPKATPRPSEPPKATPKASEPPKATPKASEPPKATPKASEPPKAVPQFSEPPKETPKQVNGEMSQPAAPSKDEVDGGLFSKPPAGETSNKSTVGDSNKVNLREKQPIRRFHSATDTSEGNKTAPASGLGIIDKRSSWMPKQEKKREDCAVCGRAVYAMERLEADKVVYHKTCFKCSVCRKTLSTGTYAALQGKIYCKVHFKQLFKIKGNYDEGFGREQHKTKWIKKEGQSEC